ncbi:hypothetical protein D3C85_1551200 [compost metagenome]
MDKLSTTNFFMFFDLRLNIYFLSMLYYNINIRDMEDSVKYLLNEQWICNNLQ